MLKDSLEKLRRGVQRAQHDFNPSLEMFAELNVERIRDDRKIRERGRERGEQNEPAAGESSLDAVETEIVHLVETEALRAKRTLDDLLETYETRLAILDFEGRADVIQNETKKAISEFDAIVQRGLNDIHASRREVVDREQELADFKRLNKIARPPYIPHQSYTLFRWGILLALGLVETFGNTTFLAKSNALGYVGASTEAIVISFLNLGLAYFASIFGWRWMANGGFGRRFLGLLVVVAHISAAMILNLLVAHYREVSGTVVDNGGFQAVRAFLANPIGLNDFQSWILLGMGLLFALITLVDVYWMDDPYPGYGRVGRYRTQAQDKFIRIKNDIIDEIADQKDDAVSALEEARQDISKRRAEYGSIVSGRSRLFDRFETHMAHLELAGNLLLQEYRDANRSARRGRAPKRFRDKWELNRPAIDQLRPFSAISSEQLGKLYDDVSTALSQGGDALHAKYLEALMSFKNLDDLIDGALERANLSGEPQDGPTAKSAA